MDLTPFAARQIKTQVQIGSVTVPVNAINMSHEINSAPYVQLSIQLDNQNAQSTQTAKIGAVDINLKTFGKLNALMQEHILNDFSLQTDLQVQVTDGDGNTILFKGYLGKPTFSVQNGQLMLGVSGVHAMAILQAFNGNIYQMQENYAMPNFADFFSDPTLATAGAASLAAAFASSNGVLATATALNDVLKSLNKNPVKNDSVAQRIKVILNGVMSKFVSESNFVTASGFISQEPLNKLVDKLNRLVLPTINTFLDASTVSTVVNNISNSAFSDIPLHLLIYEVITGRANFLISVQSYLQEFMFQLNAEWSGNFWMEHLGMQQPPGSRLIKAPIQKFDFSMSSLFDIPLLQVIVQGGGAESWALTGSLGPYLKTQAKLSVNLPSGSSETASDAALGLRSVARYPAQVASDAVGMYFVVPAPGWVNVDELTNGTLVSVDSTGDPFQTAVITQKSLLSNLANQEAARSSILGYIAEFAFKDAYLQKTSATVVIPLNVLPQVGRTYNVQSITGTPLFSAYLFRVSHDIALENSGGSATTRLDFSHVVPSGSVITALAGLPVSESVTVDDLRILDTTAAQA